MTNREGTPIWYELMTGAPDAAQKFYSAVMGWSFRKPQGGLDRDYRVFAASDGDGVGGVMKAPDGASFAPIWTVYFGVSDVDAMAEKVKSLGGSVHMGPQDIPGIGRFAFVADPQGAIFYLMRGDSEQSSTAFAATAGHFSWNELVTSDQKAALDFYGRLFGWTKAGAMPMGEMGDYTFIQSGEMRFGAMMDDPKGTHPYWNFATQVADIDAAKSAIEAAGGTIRMGPHELPEDSGWLIQATDPQGAKIMFSGPRL